MFWDSTAGALNVLMHWQTYVAGLEYVAICIVPMAAIGLYLQSHQEGPAATRIGCISMLVLPLVQVSALCVFILTMWPIIFGTSDRAAWEFPFVLITKHPMFFIKLVGSLLIAAVILAFVPFLGRLQSVQTLVLGGLALILVIALLAPASARRIELWPGFWFSVGIVVVGGLMAWVGHMVSAMLATALESFTAGLATLLLFPLAAIFGFIPVFIYGAWLGAQLRATS